MTIDSNKPPEHRGPARSALSDLTAAILDAINQLPDVREAKVRDIRRRIETGVYDVDSRKVAEKILGEMRRR